MVTHLLARLIAFYQGPPFHSNQVLMNEQIHAIDVASYQRIQKLESDNAPCPDLEVQVSCKMMARQHNRIELQTGQIETK